MKWENEMRKWNDKMKWQNEMTKWNGKMKWDREREEGNEWEYLFPVFRMALCWWCMKLSLYSQVTTTSHGVSRLGQHNSRGWPAVCRPQWPLVHVLWQKQKKNLMWKGWKMSSEQWRRDCEIEESENEKKNHWPFEEDSKGEGLLNLLPGRVFPMALLCGVCDSLFFILKWRPPALEQPASGSVTAGTCPGSCSDKAWEIKDEKMRMKIKECETDYWRRVSVRMREESCTFW